MGKTLNQGGLSKASTEVSPVVPHWREAVVPGGRVLPAVAEPCLTQGQGKLTDAGRQKLLTCVWRRHRHRRTSGRSRHMGQSCLSQLQHNAVPSGIARETSQGLAVKSRTIRTEGDGDEEPGNESTPLSKSEIPRSQEHQTGKENQWPQAPELQTLGP